MTLVRPMESASARSLPGAHMLAVILPPCETQVEAGRGDYRPGERATRSLSSNRGALLTSMVAVGAGMEPAFFLELGAENGCRGGCSGGVHKRFCTSAIQP